MPYELDALEPVLSEATVRFHRNKQMRYARATADLVRETPMRDLSLGQIAVQSTRLIAEEPSAGRLALYEQANQAWNHALMWASMAPVDAHHVRPTWIEGLRDDWITAASNVFGSGWVWLILTPSGRCVVEATEDADRPSRGWPIAVMDVWEHAYYLDFPDAKSAYVDAWWTRLADWRVAVTARDTRGAVYPGELS